MNLTDVHRLPDLTFGPLRLWALGRQFPDSSDQWDGNWLTADISPDDRTQTHRFHFELDQTFLRPLIFGHLADPDKIS
jgi:hypothetical protein